MKSFKRIIATILLCITLFLSVFNSYSMTMTVQATEVAAVPFIQSVLSLFGVSSGLGNQSDFWYRASYFENVVNAVKNGLVYKFSDYGDVDFSDSDSVNKWLKWSRGFENFIKTSATVGGGSTYTAAMVTMAKALDAVSYKVSGSSASASISNNIQTVIDEAESGAIVDDIKETFKTISDDVADSEVDWRKMSLAFGVIGSSLLSDASLCGKFQQALVSPAETVYDEYADSFADADGFSGDYQIDSSGKYVYRATMSDPSTGWSTSIDDVSLEKVFGILSKGSTYDSVYFHSYPNGNVIKLHYKTYDSSGKTLYDNYTSAITDLNLSCNFPIYSSLDAAIEAYNNSDYSSALNISDASAYPTFKSNVISIEDDLPFARFFEKNPSIAKIKGLTTAIDDDLPSVVGTKDYAPAISKAVTDSIADAGTDTDTPPVSTNYSGILGRILAAILALAASIWELFCSPITAIVDSVTMISDFVKALVNTSDTWIKELADYLEAILAGILALDMTVQFPFGSPEDESGDSSGSSKGTVNFLNGLLILIYIIFMLLKIFLHLLEFIINIFKIPAAPGFITGDFATGFNYIKSVQLSPLNISVYDFLMGLIHILLIFSVVKTLKHHIDKIHL